MKADQPIKVAFGSVPKDGGTFTFYRNIRYADEGCVRLASNSLSMKQQAQVFTDWVQDNDINCVMAINSEGILSAIPHLPGHVRVLSRCANAFDHGYRTR